MMVIVLLVADVVTMGAWGFTADVMMRTPMVVAVPMVSGKAETMTMAGAVGIAVGATMADV